VRGLARAVGGLLQTGVDVPRRLGELAAGRHDDVSASRVGSVDCTGNDHHARRQYDAAGHDSAEQHAPGWNEPDPAAAGFEHAAEIRRLSIGATSVA